MITGVEKEEKGSPPTSGFRLFGKVFRLESLLDDLLSQSLSTTSRRFGEKREKSLRGSSFESVENLWKLLRDLKPEKRTPQAVAMRFMFVLGAKADFEESRGLYSGRDHARHPRSSALESMSYSGLPSPRQYPETTRFLTGCVLAGSRTLPSSISKPWNG